MECTWGEKVGELAKRKAMETLAAYETRQREVARQWEEGRRLNAVKAIREMLEVVVCQDLAVR